MVTPDVQEIHRYPPAGACIYCGATSYDPSGGKLHEEHIIARSLGGTLILPEASCKACEKITSQFEQIVARDIFGVVRIKEGVRTRNKKERPSSSPMQTEDGSTRLVPTSEHPGHFPVFVFPKPSIINGNNRPSEIRFDLIAHASQGAEDAVNNHGWNGRVETSRRELFAFIRTLAKIGHAKASAVLGHGSFKPYLLDIINGQKMKDAPLYIGSTIVAPPDDASRAYNLIMAYRLSPSPSQIMVKVQLFAYMNMPQYWVVVGEAENEEQLANMTRHAENREVLQVAFGQNKP